MPDVETTSLISKYIQEYSIIGAIFIALSSFLYKVWRVVKKDSHNDSFESDEKNFRTMLLLENKENKEQNIQLLIENGMLKSEIAKLNGRIETLQEKLLSTSLTVH